MKAGASRVLAADIDPYAVAAVALNADANGVRIDTTTADLLDGLSERFDAILVGDLFYERDLAIRVLGFLTQARDHGALVLAGDPSRSYFPKETFRRLAEYSVPVTRDLEDMEIKRTAVWRLAP
jgi:predicted nicotinamide N-methyase